MFPTDRGDRLGNVMPGTVIENNGGKDICEPPPSVPPSPPPQGSTSLTQRFFFLTHFLFCTDLVAHSGLQGTVRPTRYAMLMDQNNLSATDFQRLTNSICWNYARATRAVSIGEKLQLAKKTPKIRNPPLSLFFFFF